MPRRGVLRAAGDRRCPGQRAAVDPKQFEKVTLNDRPGEPVSLAVLPDRRVLHTTRTGEVRLFDPADAGQHARRGGRRLRARRGRASRASRSTRTSTSNHWVYLYYSPRATRPRTIRRRRSSTRATRRSRARPARLGRVQGRAAPLALQARGRQARPRHGAEDHRRAGRPRHLLPRRRPDRLRPAGQPVPVDR